MSEEDRQRLRDELAERLRGDVVLEVHVDESRASRQAEALAEELCALSEALHLEIRRDRDRAHLPTLALAGAARGELTFIGLPTGFEFPTFIESIYAVSTGELSLTPDSMTRLSAVAEDIHLRVFTAPT